MKRRTQLTLGVAFVLAFVAVGSIQLFAVGTATSANEEVNTAATLDPVKGTDLLRIRLSPLAAQRLGLKTDFVRGTKLVRKGAPMNSVPYGSLLYDDQGATWVYRAIQPLVFVRMRVDVDLIDGARVILSKGPAVGTRVATVGTAELYGSEFEITDE
jgi:hypothetical protein